MKENWPKIAIFIGMLILQIGLAYGLVKYILPPRNITYAEESMSSSVDEKNEISAMREQDLTEMDESFGYEESDSIITSRPNVMDNLSEYIEEDFNEEEYKDLYTFNLDELVINPSDSRGSKFVVMSMTIITRGKDVDKKVELKLPAIHDAINTLIGRKTVTWLTNIDNRPFLREDIKLLLESILKDTKVMRVYFTKYLFQ